MKLKQKLLVSIATAASTFGGLAAEASAHTASVTTVQGTTHVEGKVCVQFLSGVWISWAWGAGPNEWVPNFQCRGTECWTCDGAPVDVDGFFVPAGARYSVTRDQTGCYGHGWHKISNPTFVYVGGTC